MKRWARGSSFETSRQPGCSICTRVAECAEEERPITLEHSASFFRLSPSHTLHTPPYSLIMP